MKYVIMCGGIYSGWEKPRSLYEVNDEPIVARTIRLLQEEGVQEIFITAQDERFEQFGVPVLHHDNPFKIVDDKTFGYWLDAFYPDFESDVQVTYLFGDVIFTKAGIHKVVTCTNSQNTLFGTNIARNKGHHNWGEPFAYRVVDYTTFMNGVKEVKKLFDEGKIIRHPIVWELYRYLNGLDINVQAINDETYVVINDETMDTDSPGKLNEVRAKFKDKEKI